jgi:hypothetical protein
MGGRISRCFPHVNQCFGVHVLMSDRQLVEITGVLRKIGAREKITLPLEYVCEIRQSAVAVRQVESPACVVRNSARVPQTVRLFDQRRLAMIVPERPVFMEPSDMADLPQHRIDDIQFQTHQLIR